MKYVRPTAATLFVIADHYKGSMHKTTRWDGTRSVKTWELKIYRQYGSVTEYVDDTRAAQALTLFVK